MSTRDIDEDTEGVEIRVNGEVRTVSSGITVTAFLREIDVDPRGVVVELNREILRGEELRETTLEPDDTMEIVQFVGGG